MQIITTYPIWYISICLLLGAGISALLYYRSAQLSDFRRGLVLMLAVIRFLAISVLAFFLLEPMLKLVRQEVEKPVIAVGIDNSESMMMTADSAAARQLVNEQLAQLRDQLGVDYEIRTYSFGQDLREDAEFAFSDQETDISSFLSEIQNRYSNRNLGAVVIASDGLYNRGLNPIHQTNKIGAPIYTIALGDTTPQRDVVIREVVHNELAYLGNDFPIEVLVEARGFTGASTALTIQHNGKEVADEVINFTEKEDQQVFKFFIEATETGIQRYTISAQPLQGEFTTANNVRDIYIEVLDSKQKLLVVANAPHPDIRAMRLAVEANDNYAFELYFPGDKIPPLEGYHLVVLHGLPSRKHDMANLLDRVNNDKIPAWFILSQSTDLSAFNNLESGLAVTDTRNSTNAANAAFNATFSLFNVDQEQGNYFSSLPPLSVPFGDYAVTSQGQTLMYQRIGSVKTEFPLWTFGERDGWKTAVLSGEGIWRWRTMSYADRGSHATFNSLVQKTVQYLASRENKQFLRISGAKSFRENEDVVFRAETYNPSYELYTDPDVQMLITDEDGKEYEYNFSRTGNTYRLNAGRLPSGNYQYTVAAVSENDRHVAKGAFSVEEVNIESVSIAANHRLLYQLASSTGGEMLYPQEISTLADRVENSTEIASVVYERKELADLINLRWIFFVLLALFAVEWFIRKRNGAY